MEQEFAWDEVQEIERQLQAKLDGAKDTLAQELARFSRNFETALKYLRDESGNPLTAKALWKDSRFSTTLSVLQLFAEDDYPTKGATAEGGKYKFKKGEVEPLIIQVLADGEKTHAEIVAALSAKVGGAPINNQTAKLESMIEEGTLTSAGKLRARKFSLKPQKK